MFQLNKSTVVYVVNLLPSLNNFIEDTIQLLKNTIPDALYGVL